MTEEQAHHDKQMERAAYIAAHAIYSANTSAPRLACAGGRRSHAIDTIAKIIIETLKAHDAATEPQTSFRADSKLIEIKRRMDGTHQTKP